MKPIFTYLLILTLFTRCTKEELPVTGRGNLNQDTDITINQTIELTGSSEGNPKSNKVKVTFARLEDSRCPMNAFCIRNGSAVVQFQLTQNNESDKTIKLVIGDALPNDTRSLRSRSADTTLVRLGNSQYQVILKKVTPYPCSGCPNQEVAKASIQVIAQ